MQQKIAVFDIDGTIFRWTFIAEILTTLTKKGIFSHDVIKQTEKFYFDWKDRKGSWDEYINSVVMATNTALKGIDEKEIDIAVSEIIKHKKDNVYIYTRDLIKKLKQDGYFLLAISASPEKIVAEFTKALGFNAYFGTIYEVKNGKFTGNELNNIIATKHEILEKFIEQNPDLTLNDSVGVGDSFSDIAFMEMTQNPIAFNPEKRLAEFAKVNNWKIVVERKNVIYEIKEFEFSV